MSPSVIIHSILCHRINKLFIYGMVVPGKQNTKQYHLNTIKEFLSNTNRIKIMYMYNVMHCSSSCPGVSGPQ